MNETNENFSTTNSTELSANYAYLFLIGSSFFYGTNFIPIKQYNTGDGMFFQLILCLSIWTVGVIVNCYRNFPKFSPLPLLSGFIWTTGNINTVPVIQSIGIGLSFLISGEISLITGWATARFGWFGLNVEIPTKVYLNYVAVSIILTSTVFYLFVKTETNKSNNNLNLLKKQNADHIQQESEILDSKISNFAKSEENQSFFESMPPARKRFIGISLSIFAGLCFGQTYTPILYTIDNDPTASKNKLDYLFSFYTGILISSIFYFTIYCIYKKNKPILYPQIVLPGLISGWMWGIANIFYFLSLNAISQAVSFPIANSGPPIFSNIWGIFLYKEIRGIKNFMFLLGGFAFAITGSILCGLSF